MMKDSHLESMVRFLSRAKPLYLRSELDDEVSALGLVSGEKVFFKASIPSTIRPSIFFHELIEVAQNRRTIFKQLALAHDFAFALGVHEGDSPQKLETKNATIILNPCSMVKRVLDASAWEVFSEAFAIYQQINTEITNGELLCHVLDDMAIHRKDVLRLYAEIEDLVTLILDRCTNIHETPPDLQIRGLRSSPELQVASWVQSTILGTLKPLTLKARFEFLKEICQHIPPWSFKEPKTLLKLWYEHLRERKDLDAVNIGLDAFFNAYTLIPLLYLIEGDLSSEFLKFSPGIFNEVYFSRRMFDALPVAYCIAEDLRDPFRSSYVAACMPTKDFSISDVGREEFKVASDIESEFKEDIESNEFPRGFASYSILTLHLEGIVLKGIELARRISYDTCLRKPELCHAVEGGKANLAGAQCHTPESFPENLKSILEPIYDVVAKPSMQLKYLRKDESGRLICKLPLVDNLPSRLSKEEALQCLSAWQDSKRERISKT
jgi:hypothetical protein